MSDTLAKKPVPGNNANGGARGGPAKSYNPFEAVVAYVAPTDKTLFADLVSVYKRRLWISDENAAIAAAYVLFTWSLNSHKHCPREIWWSATFGEGKSAGWDLTADLVSKPYIANGISAPGIARIIGKYDHPTICIDEVDNWFIKASGDQLAILNKGFDPKEKAIFVKLTSGAAQGDDDWGDKQFNVWAPIVMGCHKVKPPGGMARRSIILVAERAPHDWEQKPLYPDELAKLKARAAAWAATMPYLGNYQVPRDISPEFRDAWRPLLASAMAFGVDLRPIALARTEDSTQENIRLLRDVRVAFGDATELSSDELIRRLDKMDDAPWGSKWESMKEKAIQMWLSREIGNFEVDGRKVKPGELTWPARCRGYKRSQLEPLWSRYLRAAPEPAPHNLTSAPTTKRGARSA